MKNKVAILLFLSAFFSVAQLPRFVELTFAAEDANDIRNKIDKYQNQQEQIQKQLDSAQSSLARNQAQVGSTRNLIQKTETEISRKEQEAEDLDKRNELNRALLEGYLQEAYINDQDPTISLVLGDGEINEIVGNLDQMEGVRGKLLLILNEINESKQETEKVKAELGEKKDDHEKLLSIQQGQQYEIKSDINQAQSSLAELKSKINKLRGELSGLLGSSVSFNNIIDAAAYAAKVTGVRKDYLLGVLVVESNLGRYTGGCNFKESRMSGARAATFKDICKELKYDYAKQKVSCPPSGYKGTGGAMGVAQFMPDTWSGYKSLISSVTGHNPPDPWSLTDGVVAMALKLAKVSGVTAHKESAEAKAYCVYLAGGNWASYCDSSGVNYGAKVLYWADNYEKLMN